jgi:hypothetical protein
MGSIRRRALAAAGAALAGVVAGGPGVAAAAPPEDTGADRSTAVYARSSLTGPGELVAFVNVTSFDGAAPTADLAIFVSGYTCLTTDPLAVTLDPLESATAEGEVDLVCTPDNSPEDEFPDGGPTLTGTATVDLTWTGVGKKLPQVFTGNVNHCVGAIFERDVVLTGSVEVDVAGLYTGSTTDYRPYTDTALRYETVACPSGLG